MAKILTHPITLILGLALLLYLGFQLAVGALWLGLAVMVLLVLGLFGLWAYARIRRSF